MALKESCKCHLFSASVFLLPSALNKALFLVVDEGPRRGYPQTGGFWCSAFCCFHPTKNKRTKGQSAAPAAHTSSLVLSSPQCVSELSCVRIKSPELTFTGVFCVWCSWAGLCKGELWSWLHSGTTRVIETWALWQPYFNLEKQFFVYFCTVNQTFDFLNAMVNDLLRL